MDIVHIAAELTPIAKVGGLGDVLLGLCRATLKKNHKVEIILPKYDILQLDELDSFEITQHDFQSHFEGTNHHNTIWKGSLGPLSITFIEAHDPYGFFERGTIYGCPDDIERFSYFSQAAVEYLFKKERLPDILHLHDWHSALIAPLLDTKGFTKPKTILTLHNLSYQGKCSRVQVEKIGLKIDDELKKALQDENNPLEFNLLKGGIIYSNALTTVSKTYAKETLTEEYSCGLTKTLHANKHKYIGITNGIDETYWNPEKDPALPYHFSFHSLDQQKNTFPFIESKEKIKSHLRKVLSLPNEKIPLVVSITRLVYQKAPQLIKHALIKTLQEGGQFILLGTPPDKKTHDEFYALKREYAENQNVHIELTYNEKLSHLVFAASDLFIIPSLFEPCGLTQLIAMRYGSLPLARCTGGLADTVKEGVNGFLFHEPTEKGISEALKSALNTYKNHPLEWKKLMKNALSKDVSWNRPCEEYLKIYHDLIHQTSSPTSHEEFQRQ